MLWEFGDECGYRVSAELQKYSKIHRLSCQNQCCTRCCRRYVFEQCPSYLHQHAWSWFSHYRLDMDCIGRSTCKRMTITGSSNSVLNIQCDGEGGCSTGGITGGTNSEINLVCDGQGSCVDLVVYAPEAAIFRHECTGSGSCADMTIFGKIDCIHHLVLMIEMFKNAEIFESWNAWKCWDFWNMKCLKMLRFLKGEMLQDFWACLVRWLVQVLRTCSVTVIRVWVILKLYIFNIWHFVVVSAILEDKVTGGEDDVTGDDDTGI